MRLGGRVSLVGLLAVALLGSAGARANPDVWVTAAVIFEVEDQRVNALTFVWRFDEYFSSRAVRTYDQDGDGALGPGEVAVLRAESFDPLERFSYYVHLWTAGKRREGVRINRFTARVDGTRLVYEFSVPVVPAVGPDDGPMTVSLLDEQTVVDFRFAESDFLLLDGALAPGCKFRVARGKGAQSGHPRPVTLHCGG